MWRYDFRVTSLWGMNSNETYDMAGLLILTLGGTQNIHNWFFSLFD